MFRFIMTTLSACALISCSDAPTTSAPVMSGNALPPIQTTLACLRGNGPIIAAHRGRDKIKRHPENALSSLKSLKQDGFIIAEVDVAGLKDGTHILHHDGIWDETTTGKGIVAATSWEQAETFLMKTRKGNAVSERLTKLEDTLEWAAQDFYLEIDFKSSANEKAVLNAIKDSAMTQHVILIAYNDKQAAYLRGLSRRVTGETMMISGPKGSTSLYWMGTKSYNSKQAKASAAAGNFTAFGMMSPRYAKNADYAALSILVSDFPGEAKEKAGVKLSDRNRVKACQ